MIPRTSAVLPPPFALRFSRQRLSRLFELTHLQKTGCKFGDVSIWPVRPRTHGLVLGTWICKAGYKVEGEQYYTILAPPTGVHVADKDYDGVDESGAATYRAVPSIPRSVRICATSLLLSSLLRRAEPLVACSLLPLPPSRLFPPSALASP
jgi:hypothetical protein